MVKVTLKDGTVVEGTSEEIYALDLFVETDEVVTDAHTFKEGDAVRVLADGQFFDIENGSIGIILDTDATDNEHDPFTIHVQSDGDDDYFRPQDLEFAPVELAEEEEAPLAVGDFAKVVVSNTEFNGTYEVGSIVKITKIDESSVPYKAGNDGNPSRWFRAEHLTKVSDEEVATAKAQAESNARGAIFTENGRKPNEYRKGDIVKITSPTTSINSEGDIGEVSETDTDGTVRIQVNGKGYRGNWTLVESVTLLTFVESRLDRK